MCTYQQLCYFGNNMLVKYGQELHLSRISLLLFPLIIKITSVALIENMFLFNKKIYNFCFPYNIFFYYFFRNSFSQNYFPFLKMTLLTSRYPPPPHYHTYVQTITGSITRHHLTYVCNIIYYLHSLLLCLGSSQLSSNRYKDLLSHFPLTRQVRPRAL